MKQNDQEENRNPSAKHNRKKRQNTGQIHTEKYRRPLSNLV